MILGILSYLEVSDFIRYRTMTQFSLRFRILLKIRFFAKYYFYDELFSSILFIRGILLALSLASVNLLVECRLCIGGLIQIGEFSGIVLSICKC